MGLKPMNCPAHVQLYKRRAPLLPRPADPLLRARPRAPPRAERHAPRPAARPPHHPGRRPHLLHRGADRGGGRSAAWTSASRSTTRSASSRASSSRPGPRSGSAPRRCGTAPRRRCSARSSSAGLEYELNAGDGAFYGPEDRPAHDRLDRPLVAARTVQLDYVHARALRPHLHRRRQRRAPAGDDPPRADGLLRALHRHPDRALRGRVPALAGAGPGASCCRSPTATPTTRARSRPRCAEAGLRAELDDRTESVGRKIREAELRKVPYMLVVGDREAEAGRGRAAPPPRGRPRDRRRSTRPSSAWRPRPPSAAADRSGASTPHLTTGASGHARLQSRRYTSWPLITRSHTAPRTS